MNALDLTPEQIAPAFPGAKLSNIAKFWPFVREALRENQITSPVIVAATLGTIAAETAGFVPMTEMKSKWNTRIKFGDRYDGRDDLGNTTPGDGARYPGRGFVQITGKHNYWKYGERIGVDLVKHPEKANEPSIAAQLLALFISDRDIGIKIAIEDGNLPGARKLVNGGSHGLDRFTKTYQAIMGVLRG